MISPQEMLRQVEKEFETNAGAAAEDVLKRIRDELTKNPRQESVELWIDINTGLRERVWEILQFVGYVVKKSKSGEHYWTISGWKRELPDATHREGVYR